MKIVLSLLALIYTFFPYDVLPDFMIGWGWLDDIVILYLLWRYFYKGNVRRFGKPSTDDRAGRKAGTHSGTREGGSRGEEDASGRTGDGPGILDPYEVLGITRDASADEVRIAYKKLAGKYHPDKVLHLGQEFQALAEKRFKEIQTAYQKLSGK